MRLPYLQVSHEDSRRIGAELQALDKAKRPARWWRGLLEDVWAWGLSLGGDDRPTGLLDHPSAPDRLAGILEWNEPVQTLLDLLEIVGVIEVTKRGGIRVRGVVERYGRAWDSQRQREVASAKGVEARKNRPAGQTIGQPLGATKTETETETERRTIKEALPISGKKPPEIEHPLQALWNLSVPPRAPRCPKWSATKGTRLKSANVRLDEHPELPWWQTVFDAVVASDFLAGRRSDWCATPDWILNPTNLLKVVEGNYANGPPTGQQRAGPTNANQDFPLGDLNAPAP